MYVDNCFTNENFVKFFISMITGYLILYISATTKINQNWGSIDNAETTNWCSIHIY